MEKTLKLLLLTLFVLPFAGLARPISEEEATRAAAQWLSRTPRPLGTKPITKEKVSARAVRDKQGDALFHVVRFSGGGFIAMSAETGITPVIALSDSGDLPESHENPLYAILVADMSLRKAQVAKARSANMTANKGGKPFAAEEEWEALLSDEQPPAGKSGMSSISDVRVSPLIQTTWGQSDGAANYYTPPYSAGSANNYVCGCVALAGAQIARFWRYPTSSRPQFTRTCSVSNSSQSFTTKGGTYAWDNMPLAFNSLSSAQKQAIGKLCYDFGVATYMNWASGGSGTGGYCLDDAFTTVFGYANSRVYVEAYDDAFTQDVIKKTIFANLDAGCPVSLGIDGHMIDADGYGYHNGTPYTHLNLGWSGSYDAWYNLPEVNTWYNSSVLDEVIYNIFPQKTGDLLTGRVLDSAGNPVSGATVSVGGATVTTGSKGIYAFWVNGGESWTVTASHNGTTGSRSVYVTKSISTTISGRSYYPGTGTPGNSWGNDITLSGTTPSAPSAPSWVSASDGTYTDKVLVEWGASSGASSYSVYRASSSSGTKTALGSTSSTSWSDTGATAGTTYYYWVKASNAAGTSGYSSYDTGYRASAPSRPGNDDFANAYSISGSSGSTSGSNANATTQSGEPSPTAQSNSGASVWWRWTAPENGTAVFDTTGSSFDTVLAIYTGSSVSSLSSVCSDDDGAGNYASLCSFSVTAGTIYRISVRGYSSNTGSITLNWTFTPSATAPDAPSWVSASDGTYSDKVYIEWDSSSDTTSYTIYRATSSSGTKTTLGTTSSPLWNDTTATAGTTYYYWVKASNSAGTSGFSSYDTGYRAQPPSRPGNDNFASAFSISGSSGSTTGSSVNATRETGEPQHNGRTTGSVWWRWTAPGNGTAVFNTTGSSFDTVLAIYTGSSVSSLSSVCSDDDGAGNYASRCEFTVTSGTIYRIAVAGYSSSGAITLNWSFTGTSVPSAPSWVDASDGGYTDKVYVEWGASSGATSYTVYRATSSSGTKTTLGTTSSRSWNDTTATAGTTYYYWVKASNSAGTSGFSSYDTGYRTTAPSASGKYALCVGINVYSSSYGAGSLNGCVNDATFFSDSLTQYGGWESQNITLLTDSAATKSAIRSAIANYASRAVAGDTFLYVHSSHGGQSSGRNVYLCSHNDDYTDSELASDLAQFRSGVKVVVIVDACHSGGLFKGSGAQRPKFNLAERVTAILDETRKAERALNAKAATAKISSNEIGWVTAADYDEYSWDGGYYDTTSWFWGGDRGSVKGGVFMAAFIWGWWNGEADDSGDRDEYFDAYEGWDYAYDVCVEYADDFTPQYLNEGVLRSVELGRSGCGAIRPEAPVNDNFSDAIALSGNSGSTTGTNIGATRESGEPSHAGQTSSLSVWWYWTAPGNGTAVFDTTGSSFDTVLAIYTGNSVSSLSGIASNDDYSDDYSSRCEFSVSAGTTYRIAVGGYSSNTGSISLNWSFFEVEIPSRELQDAVDNSTLQFTTGGDADWFGQASTTHDGTDAAQSGEIGDSQSSWMQTTVSGPGTISFWWNASTEDVDYDWLEFLVDGAQQAKIGGLNASWQYMSFTISGSGTHTLRWNYRKDSMVTDGSDCGWVDQVVWTPTPTDTFEQSIRVALDNMGLAFSAGGNAQWHFQTSTSHDGVDAAQSGDINDNQSSWMQTTVSGSGTLTFWWKVSSEIDYDYLKLYVDGSLTRQISGSTTWEQVTVMVTGSGSHTIKWAYSKDVSVSEDSDCGWVDQVVWTPVVLASGTLPGSSLTWSIAGTTLTISGNGPMPDYTYEEPPYLAYAYMFTKIVVEEGVTEVGDNAFQDLPYVTSVSLPETLTYIGIGAFADCTSLDNVVIPNSVTTIGEGVFSGCDSMEMLYLPQRFVPYIDDLDIPDTCSVANTDVYNFLRRLYNLCLGREPDWVGCANWAKGLTSHSQNGAMTAYGFFLSAEMGKRNLSNAYYVEILYRVLMDRAPDAAGKAHWIDLLAKGISRAGVFQGFAESAEFTRICARYGISRGNVDRSRLEQRDLNSGVTMFVARCYTKALNRNYDVAGLNHWCEKINSSSAKKAAAIQVSKSFLTSVEFQRRHLSNSAFVDVLYQTFLGRAPDAAGKQKWVAKLNSGVNRNTIMAGFYNSNEFTQIMAGYGIR